MKAIFINSIDRTITEGTIDNETFLAQSIAYLGGSPTVGQNILTPNEQGYDTIHIDENYFNRMSILDGSEKATFFGVKHDRGEQVLPGKAIIVGTSKEVNNVDVTRDIEYWKANIAFYTKAEALEKTRVIYE